MQLRLTEMIQQPARKYHVIGRWSLADRGRSRRGWCGALEPAPQGLPSCSDRWWRVFPSPWALRIRTAAA